MSIIRITGLSFWLLAGCLFTSAQSYHVQRFTTENGLPSNGIKGIQWDEQTGFLWIATEAGVVRYNGVDFRWFNRDNSPGMYSERMLFLLKTREGRIFTSDETGDLFFVSRNKLQFIGKTRVDTRPASFRLTGLVASGRLFRQSSTQAPPDFGFSWSHEQLIPLSETRLLLTHNDSLYDYRLGRPAPVYITTLEPNSRLFYLDSLLFEFNGRGCSRLDITTRRRTPVRMTGWKPGREWPALSWDNSMKNPILISGSDAWTLDYDGEKLSAHLVCTALPADGPVGYVKYDSSSGLLFAGTLSKGLIVIRRNQVRPVRVPPDSPAARQTAYYSQIRLGSDRILTNEGAVLPAGKGTSLPIHPPFNNFVLQEGDSTLWYSVGDTVYSFSFKTHLAKTVLTDPGSITDGFARSGKDLCIANAIGIGMLDGSSIDYGFRYPQDNVASNVPFAMQEISPGRIAVATCEGLFSYHAATRRLDTLLRIPGICVRALWQYKGYLFIGTYGRGIWLYKDGRIKPIPPDKNGYLQYAHCFLPDRLGYCWISTNRGLFRVRPEEMTEAFAGGRRSIGYHYYGREDGMDMTELNGGCTPCALQLNDTTLSFPSMDGLVWVNPALSIPVLPEGSVYIDAFVADSQRINITSLLKPVLPANTRDLSFDLAFPAWLSKENLAVEYKLEPYSSDWQLLDPAHDPELHFSNLPYGDYRLLIRKPNDKAPNAFSLTICSFYIRPHWYQRLWSWLLFGCLFSGLFIAIVRWRTRRFKIRQDNLEKQIAEKTRQLQAKNEELERTDLIKTRLISIISHDLVTPLRFLHLTSKNLIEKKNVLTEDLQQEAITEMATTSKELELLGTNILNWIKYRNEDRRLVKESFDLQELVAQVFGVLGPLARQKGLSLISGIGQGQVLYQYIEPVKIVLYNLILNGINFTTRGHIRVSSDYAREGIVLQIEDTGVGMTGDQINNIMADHFIISSANVDNRKGNGLGYLIIKDLLKIVRGTLSIRSEKEKGTHVSVWMPV